MVVAEGPSVFHNTNDTDEGHNFVGGGGGNMQRARVEFMVECLAEYHQRI